jgi:methionine aminopeptidase
MQVAAAYKCSPLEGVLSHQMKKHVIDANKVIINKASAEHTVSELAADRTGGSLRALSVARRGWSRPSRLRPCLLSCCACAAAHGLPQVKEVSVDKGDVFSIDIVMSTGEGKPKLTDKRTTVFKRDVQEKYSLKMKASRAFFSEVNARFPTLPFTLRAGDERAWRMGVVECVKHGLFNEYPVLYEKQEEMVAQVKFTAAVLPSGNIARTTTSPPPNATSECKLEDKALVSLLATEIASKKKKKNKKKTGEDKEDKE